MKHCDLDHDNLHYLNWLVKGKTLPSGGIQSKLSCGKCGDYIKFLDKNELSVYLNWKDKDHEKRKMIVIAQSNRRHLLNEILEEITNYLAGIDINPQYEKIKELVDKLKDREHSNVG